MLATYNDFRDAVVDDMRGMSPAGSTSYAARMFKENKNTSDVRKECAYRGFYATQARVTSFINGLPEDKRPLSPGRDWIWTREQIESLIEWLGSRGYYTPIEKRRIMYGGVSRESERKAIDELFQQYEHSSDVPRYVHIFVRNGKVLAVDANETGGYLRTIGVVGAHCTLDERTEEGVRADSEKLSDIM